MFARSGLILLAACMACSPNFTVSLDDRSRFTGREPVLDGTAYAWWRAYHAQDFAQTVDPAVLELRFFGVVFDAELEWRRVAGDRRLRQLAELRRSDFMSVSVLHSEGGHRSSGQWNRDSDGRTCQVPCVLDQCQEAFNCQGLVDLRAVVVLPVPDRVDPLGPSDAAPGVAMDVRRFGSDWHLSLDDSGTEVGDRVAGTLTLTADQDDEETLSINFDVPVLNSRLAGCNEASDLGSYPSVFPCEEHAQ